MARKRLAPVVEITRLSVGDVVRFDVPGPCAGFEGVVTSLFTDAEGRRAVVDLGESVHPCLRFVRPYPGDLVERAPLRRSPGGGRRGAGVVSRL